MRPEICTYSGVRFNVFAPQPEDIRIEDIAHALSNTGRWGGHTKHFYSVAQHAWDVSYRCAVRDAGYGLLHDAAEAYLVDVPTPLKQHLFFMNPVTDQMESYRRTEHRLLEVVLQRFGLKTEDGLLPRSVEMADAAAADVERASLMPETDWYPMRVPPRAVSTQPSHQAKQLFLTRFYALVDAGALKDPTK